MVEPIIIEIKGRNIEAIDRIRCNTRWCYARILEVSMLLHISLSISILVTVQHTSRALLITLILCLSGG